MRWASVCIFVVAMAGVSFGQRPTTLPSDAWAQMLKDRKFASAITYEAGESPWKPVGIPGMVVMDKEFPYAGQQAVAIQIPGSGAETGIQQAGLSIEKGKKYTGRIVLSADEGVAPVVVQLALHDGQMLTQRIDQIGTEYKTFPLEFTAPISSNDVRLEILSNAGPGILRIGAVSLMPADNVKGFRADVVAKMKEQKTAGYLWHVEVSDFEAGLGNDPDRRAPEARRANRGTANDFGLHDFLDLMEAMGSQGLLVTRADSPELQQYVTAPATSPMGKRRAENGREKPWTNVSFSIGNW